MVGSYSYKKDLNNHEIKIQKQLIKANLLAHLYS